MNSLINKQFTILSSKHNRPILIDLRFNSRSENLPIIIFCHGFKGFKDWGHFNLIANEFVRRGYAFLKFNFSHNGTTVEHPTDFVDLEAFGHNNISTELDDLQDVIDAILKPHPSLPDAPIDKEKLYLIGHSRGGGVALLKAAEEPKIKATVAWAPVDDFQSRYSKEVLEKWKDDGVQYIQNSRTGQDMPLYYPMLEDLQKNQERLDVQKALREIQIPVLAIHGSNDETLDFRKTKEMDKLNSFVKVSIIKNTNHTFGGSHPWKEETLPEKTIELVEITDAFLKK